MRIGESVVLLEYLDGDVAVTLKESRVPPIGCHDPPALEGSGSQVTTRNPASRPAGQANGKETQESESEIVSCILRRGPARRAPSRLPPLPSGT